MSGRRRNVNIGANSIVYSGRGRPRTKETVDRPLPVGIVLGTPSPGGDIFRNRKIRVGGAFQAKVPKKSSLMEENGEANNNTKSYQSSRPAPFRVSQSHPHLTQQQVKDYKESRQQEKEDYQPKPEEDETEGPTAMEIDTTLSQTTTGTEEGTTTGSTTTNTTTSPSDSFLSNNNNKLTTTDRHSDTNSNDNNSENLTDTNSSNGNFNSNDNEAECLQTRRGGLLLYPSSVTSCGADETSHPQGGDDFWDFVQPLLMSTTTTSETNDKTSWQHQVHHWYLDQEMKRQLAEQKLAEELERQQLEQLQMPRRRGRRKRKKESAAQPEIQENILDWYVEQQAKKRPRVCAIQEEDRAHAMQHLWLRHKGQVPMAKVETMVHLSAGKAEMARKVQQHKRRRASPRANVDTLSWREYCEQSTLESMTGDFRQSNRKEAEWQEDTLLKPDNINEHQEVWKSILKLGQSIEENLIKASSGGSKKYLRLLKLSMLTSFLNNAYAVRPLPEEIFRASDVPPAINTCFNNIASYVDQARKMQAQLMDLLYETHNNGVELEALNKLLDQCRRSLAMELDDAKILQEQVVSGLEWQKRMDAMVNESDLCLTSLEELAEEGRSYAFRTKSLVCLENRIQKAYQLRDKIVEWRKKACTNDCNDDLDDKKECVKFLHAMVRDANRLKLSFPEVADLRETHRSVEAWIDRANIAIRSRISLTEIKSLIETGENMPVDLSDSMEKLRARESLAEEWIHQFETVVPRPSMESTDNSIESEKALLHWMGGMRKALNNGKYACLHDIASEGSRIPVEVDIVKLLQLELDAKNWASKAKKWVPSLSEQDSTACKKAKLDDLREHLGKVAVLRERLDLSSSAKEAWTLDGEAEIRSIVQAADDWFAKYKPYLDWDNRRSLGRSCLSLEKLRTIVNEGNAIHANIGNAIGKMTRILAQAEGWVKQHESLLLTCKIIPQDGSTAQPLDKRFITLERMTAVAEAATSDVSLDLDEAKELLKRVESVKDWSNRVANAAPKRSVRGRGRKAKFTVDDIIGLINEATDIPVDTTEDINRLQIQLSGVQEWRAQAREKLEEIANGFLKLRHVVDEMYGSPSEYSRIKSDKAEGSVENKSESKSETNISEEKKVTEEMSVCETASSAGSEHDSEGIPNFGSANCNVNQLIKVYRREAKAFGVVSGEVEAAEQLEKVSNWCVKSLKYLVNQRDVFDKRFFTAFDRFVGDGRELLNPTKAAGIDAKIKLDDDSFTEKLNSSWGTFVSDQLQRLEILVADREQFLAWCNDAEAQLYSGDKHPSLEKLKDVSDRSRIFPAVCDMVQKVRGQYNRAMEWKAATRKLLNGKEKLSPFDAKNVLDNGEKLGFCCEEMKTLRNALRAARNWTNRVKRSKVDQGSADSDAIQALIDEHDALTLEMTEEVSRLKQAMQCYCLCRRPYSGFMIGCDECEEWYHGNCIGITESKADRFDKYVCIRCSLSKVFKSTAKEAVGIVRKWTCPKDMKKARQVEAQKHQRKVRKETKDIEKFRAEIEALEASLAEPPVPEPTPAPVAVAAAAAAIMAAAAAAPAALGVGAPVGQGETPTTKPDETEAKQTPSPPRLSPEEAHAKIEKAQETIRQCGERLARLSEKGEERKAILCVEDSKAPLLRNWCLRVRSTVLVPRSDEVAEASRPLEDGSLSAPMQTMIEEAQEAGIASVSDVEAMFNAFRSMSWCMLATKILSRKPTMAECELLVNQSKRLKLTEEKALRTIKAIVLRAKAWQSKVSKALAPVPGDPKAFNVDALKELLVVAEEIPVLLKEEALLSGVIDDGGSRHCLCGGPTDARVMLSCDKCQKWFHGPCVQMTKKQCDALAKWICPPCSGSACPIDVNKCGIVWEDRDDPRQAKKRHIAPEAPDPVKMWPPFGLFASEKAREVLGNDCYVLPDVASTIKPEQVSTPSLLPAERDPIPEVQAKSSTDAMMVVPPTTLVQSADVSQELHMPLSQGLQPPNAALLADSDADAQAQLSAASSLRSTLEFSQHQAFQWLAQSGAAAAVVAATQANLSQSQPPAFGWQNNPFLSVATAAAAASLSQPTLSLTSTTTTNNTTNNETTNTSAPTPDLSALETLANLSDSAANAQLANDAQKPKAASPVESSTTGATSTKEDSTSTIHQNSFTAEQFIGSSTAGAAVTSEQPQLPSSSQLNPANALNLIVAALPVQESGS